MLLKTKHNTLLSTLSIFLYNSVQIFKRLYSIFILLRFISESLWFNRGPVFTSTEATLVSWRILRALCTRWALKRLTPRFKRTRNINTYINSLFTSPRVLFKCHLNKLTPYPLPIVIYGAHQSLNQWSYHIPPVRRFQVSSFFSNLLVLPP